MRLWVLLLWVLGLLSGDAAEKHLFLLIGQSNMAGRAPLEEVDRQIIKNGFLWNIEEKSWELAVAPFNRYSPLRKESKIQGLNCGPSFVDVYAKANPGVEVGIVCAARGGTKIGQWEARPGGKASPGLYETAVKATQDALTDGAVLKGILWHQGEGDSSEQRVTKYPKALAALVSQLRKDLKAPSVPFVFAQLSPDNDKSNAFNAMVAKQADVIEHSACVSSKGLSTGDGTHFDNVSQRELGRRYAKALLEIVRK